MVLNYSDFISKALNLRKYLQEEKLWTLYRYFDIQDKGYFNATDIVEVAAREGRNISNEEIETMMK